MTDVWVRVRGVRIAVRMLSIDAPDFFRVRMEWGGALATQIGNLGWGVACSDELRGTGYIMYSEESIFARFAAAPISESNQAEHLVCVKYESGVWTYDTNLQMVEFQPAANDILLFALDFENDRFESAAGEPAQDVGGINFGYAEGDVSIRENWYHGQSNVGEWTISGTQYFPYSTSEDYVEFDVPTGQSIFGDFIDPSIPLVDLVSSVPMLAEGSVFCKMCSESSAERFGDTCWGVLPQDDISRDCGCNSGGWAGHGVYYAGFEECNTCACRAPNAFTGVAEAGVAKGGTASAGLKIYVQTTQEWALEDLGATVQSTSTDQLSENPYCAGNVHNLMSEAPVHACIYPSQGGECGLLTANGPCVGDARFIFGAPDDDQTITVDLGQPRAISRIGAKFSIGDREVWDAVIFEISVDGQNFYQFGQVGTDDSVVSERFPVSYTLCICI